MDFRRFFSCFFIMSLVLITNAMMSPVMAQSSVSASASSWCRVVRPPQVSIKTDTDKINWVFNLSQRQLNNFDVDTINPYGNSVHTDVGGLMKGGINMVQTMRFNTVTHNGLKQSCLFYDSVSVQLKIEPSIYIAREYAPGSCRHNAIKEHELKHINVDRMIVNKYAQLIGRAIKTEIDKRALYGPVSITQEESIRQLMRTRMEGILRKINTQMENERRTRQQAIDNIQEYERVNNLCR